MSRFKKIILLIMMSFDLQVNSQTILIPEVPESEAELDLVIKLFNEVTLPQLQAVYLCSEASKIWAERSTKINTQFFIDNQREWSLPLLLKKARANNNKYLTRLIELTSKVKSYSIQSVDDSLNLASKVELEIKAFLNESRDTMQYEQDIIDYLEAMQNIYRKLLNDEADLSALLSNDYCHSFLEFSASSKKIKISLFLAGINTGEYKKTLKESHIYKQNISQFTFSTLRRYADQHYKNQIRADLTDTENLLNSALLYTRIAEDILSYIYDERNTFKEALRSTDHELHYNNAKRLLHIELAKIETLEKRLKPFIDDTFLSTTEDLIEKLELKKDLLLGLLKRLKDEGWQGQLDRQILITERYISIADRYEPHCQMLFKKQLNILTQIDSIFSFHDNSSEFARMRSKCK